MTETINIYQFEPPSDSAFDEEDEQETKPLFDPEIMEEIENNQKLLSDENTN